SLFGLKKENVLGRSFFVFFPAADKNTENLMYELLTKAKSVRNKAIRLYKQDGSLMYCLLSTEIVELDNEESMIITIMDVSKQRLMELEMARLDRLNLVGQMAGGIGHEIRNPMTTVHGFLQLLATKEKYKEDREYFDIMLSELDRANSIITEFLALSKKEISVHGRQNLVHIVKRLEPLMEATALRLGKHITYRYSTVPDICVNEKEIRQVILNLVHNAMDASDEIGISVRCDGKHVILEVRDKGPGLAPEVLENLGKPFYTTKENGTGLGLPISFSIVQRHEGFINVTAGKNGTVFAVCLPVPEAGTMHLYLQDRQLTPAYQL
ncbi:MAG TPA: PAS domain S-box protein, partial [Firmicutes bacterium]|nr:PAS domain S-box protein [Bacillota bacterium]